MYTRIVYDAIITKTHGTRRDRAWHCTVHSITCTSAEGLYMENTHVYYPQIVQELNAYRLFVFFENSTSCKLACSQFSANLITCN